MHWKFTNPDFRALSSRYNSWRLYRREKCTPDRNEERNKEKEKVRATIMVIIASLRRFKMNFYSGQSRFVGDKKEKKKKKKRRRNFKCENTCGSNSHFDGRILRDETISLSSRYMIILFFSFWFFFFFRIGDIQNAIVFFVFSLSHRSLFSLPHSFTLFFIFLDLFFFLFFFSLRTIKIVMLVIEMTSLVQLIVWHCRLAIRIIISRTHNDRVRPAILTIGGKGWHIFIEIFTFQQITRDIRRYKREKYEKLMNLFMWPLKLVNMDPLIFYFFLYFYSFPLFTAQLNSPLIY